LQATLQPLADELQQMLPVMPGGKAGASPRWSPDGRWIVFDSNKEGQFEVYRMRSNGGVPERLTRHSATDGVPSYAREGRSIYFMSSRSGSNQYGRWTLTGGIPVRSRSMEATSHSNRMTAAGYSIHARMETVRSIACRWRGARRRKFCPGSTSSAFACPPREIFSTGEHAAGIEFLNPETGKIFALFRPDLQMTVGLDLSPAEATCC
jgi:hypothetical protein